MKRPSILFLLIAALSAVLSLISCDGGFRRASMLSVLDEADSLNRNFLPLTNDTLLQEAVAYFDRHGSANERMRAHYLLGCAYRDKGQSPMAVDCYQDAIDCADTTSSDCDYRTLSAVYSQMSEQYSKQLLFSYEIEARRKSGYYAQLDKDTLYYLFEKKMIAGCYILLNKKDSAELLLKEVLRQYEENGYVQEALLASNILMHLYIFVPDRQDTLKQLIDRFDANYALFDEHHELPPGKRMFYYYKGCYFENANQIDSAEHYYKKMEYSSMPYDSKVFLYNGLYRISQKRNNTDSIFKYSKLYCAANDTTVIAKDQELTAQLAASYNYTHFQKEAREKEKAIYRIRQGVMVLLMIILGGILWTYNYRKAQKRKRKEIEEAYKREQEKLKSKISELDRIETIHQEVIEQIREELVTAQKESKDYRKKNIEAKRAIEIINNQYKNEKGRLTQEIKKLNIAVASYAQKQVIIENLEKAKNILDYPIVKRLDVLADNPQRTMTTEEMQLLETAIAETYPILLHDIQQASGINHTEKIVFLLTTLGYRPAQIQRLIDLSSSRITNMKTKLNLILFNEKTAVSLYENIVNRYSVYTR